MGEWEFTSFNNYCSQVCDVVLTDWDFAVEGEDELIDGDFWMSWKPNFLVPFAFMNDNTSQGPYTPFEYILLFDGRNSEDLDQMPVLMYSKKHNKLTKVADSISELNFEEIETNRELAETIKLEGNNLFSEGKPEEAIEKFYEALEVDPSYGILYNNIATVLVHSIKVIGDYERPKLLFYHSYVVDKNCTFGMMGHADILSKSYQFDKAIGLTQKAITIEQDDTTKADMYYFLAIRQKESGNTEEAKKSCHTGSELNNDDSRFATLLADL